MRRSDWLVAHMAILVGVFLLPVAAVGAPEKVEICHFNADDPDAPVWQLLEVSSRAIGAHESHGDGVPGSEVPGTNGQFVFDENCVPQASELIFAVAYTDVDTNDGGYNPDVDVLISKLIDGPGAANDGTLGAGDLVVTNQYPKDFDASVFGSFQVTQHEVSSVSAQGSESCQVLSESGAFIWDHVDLFLEAYNESDLPFFAPFSFIIDGFETAADDTMRLDTASPSQPFDTFTIHSFVFEDQAFIDIELNCI